MQSNIRTIYSAALQTSAILGIPLVIPEHSTLNEKFDVLTNHSISSNDRSVMKYGCIGNGGHRVVTNSNGIPYIDPIQHRPRDAALFNHLPFVLRTLDNDLSQVEAARYRLRVPVVVNGINYMAYYMKVLDLSATVEEMDLYSVSNGITTSSAFTPNSGDLNPTPPLVSNTGVVSTSGDYIAATAQVPFTLDEGEISEFKNACNIIYGNPALAIISEIALCAGVDKVTTGIFGTNTQNYTEVISAQVMNFISSFHAVEFENNGIDLLLNVGSTEAMLVA